MRSESSTEDSNPPATDPPGTSTTSEPRRNPPRAVKLMKDLEKRKATSPADNSRMKKVADNELLSNSSSPRLVASDHKNAASVLPVVGFHWDVTKYKDDIERQSYATSFDFEWNLFIQRVSQITRDETNSVNSEAAWKCFQGVIMRKNIAKGTGHVYETEQKFDDALFSALRKSLKGFIEEIAQPMRKKWIVLRNSHIGFGRKIERTTLGFWSGYALSRNNISDHSCFVLGTDELKELNIGHVCESETAKRKTDNTKNGSWYNDMTSSVELKLQDTSCHFFECSGNKINKPDLAAKHGPMVQAMLYSMDVWHCLARRGIVVETVPVVVLAGKSEIVDNDEICCLQAHIKIPKNCGPGFIYSIDEIVAFDGTAGLSSRPLSRTNVLTELAKTRDHRALAIYIRTMRIGLENALRVIENCNMSDPFVFPVSLGCYPLLQDGSTADLVASPISRELHFYNPTLNVHQGELFSVPNATKATFNGFKDVNWFIDAFNHDCLVKVSCLSVHHTYIKHDECKEALLKLHHACAFVENKDLKESIANVLLGYCYVKKSKCLVTIMKDLRNKNFQILEHQAIHDQQMLPELWRAFSMLVTSLLLPMARKDIIHHDIRSSKDHTYNILICNENDNIELLLIDFESIILSGDAVNISIKAHDNAVHMPDLYNSIGEDVVEWESAHRYLFWQVLWIAYRWHLPPSLASDFDEENHIASNFISIFLSDDDFLKQRGDDDRTDFAEFKKMLGTHASTLEKSSNKEDITDEDISNALEALQQAFQDKFPEEVPSSSS